MFKDLRQQLSFVYTECSDVTTEVFVTSNERDVRKRHELCFASSFNSVEQFRQRTQTSQTYPPPQEKTKKRPARSVRFKRENKFESFVTKSKQKPRNDVYITKLVPCGVPFAVGEYEEYDENMDSKDFDSLHGCCFEIANEEAVNDSECLYILKPPYKNHSSTLVGNMHHGSSSKEISNLEAHQAECHTVGDLLSFASNTMRFLVFLQLFIICNIVQLSFI